MNRQFSRTPSHRATLRTALKASKRLAISALFLGSFSSLPAQGPGSGSSVPLRVRVGLPGGAGSQEIPQPLPSMEPFSASMPVTQTFMEAPIQSPIIAPPPATTMPQEQRLATQHLEPTPNAYTEQRAMDSPPSYFLDNLSFQAGFDGSRAPEDLGINANMGGRVALQTAFPLIEQLGLGLQIGGGINYHHTATRFQRLNGGPGERYQVFSTLGIFQRTDSGFSWGVAYDNMTGQSYSAFDLGQWRGQVGAKVNPCNEFGIWGTYRDRRDSATFAGENFSIQTINQASFYWTHYWPSQAVLRAWVGVAETHGRAILGIPGNDRSDHPFVFGALTHIPLSPSVALFGEANFITPNDSGTVTAFLGLAFYPGARAAQALTNPFAPVLPIANNPNFSIDARR